MARGKGQRASIHGTGGLGRGKRASIRGTGGIHRSKRASDLFRIRGIRNARESDDEGAAAAKNASRAGERIASASNPIMNTRAALLPQFVRDLLASPPHRGGGLNLWFYRIARVLHPYRGSNEIVNLLQAATAGEPVKRGEIERAVERSKATAWKPGQPFRRKTADFAWPPSTQNSVKQSFVTAGAGRSVGSFSR